MPDNATRHRTPDCTGTWRNHTRLWFRPDVIRCDACRAELPPTYANMRAVRDETQAGRLLRELGGATMWRETRV